MEAAGLLGVEGTVLTAAGDFEWVCGATTTGLAAGVLTGVVSGGLIARGIISSVQDSILKREINDFIRKLKNPILLNTIVPTATKPFRLIENVKKLLQKATYAGKARVGCTRVNTGREPNPKKKRMVRWKRQIGSSKNSDATRRRSSSRK